MYDGHAYPKVRTPLFGAFLRSYQVRHTYTSMTTKTSTLIELPAPVAAYFTADKLIAKLEIAQ